ncbi:MAG: 6-carboxytetrahydropterin synthase [Bacteroidota bacterium]|nr:6-carboxytetrahydropterin synthase [Bacteroidota bacterium]
MLNKRMAMVLYIILNRYLQPDLQNTEKIVSVYRTAQFNAAHRLHLPQWTEEENKTVFGLCNNPNYHGHNYQLVVKLTGPVNHETGFVFDLKVLKQLINIHVIEAYDHRNLNLDCPDFADFNTTAENIAIVIWNKLRPYINKELKLSIKLYETERNYVKYKGN